MKKVTSSLIIEQVPVTTYEDKIVGVQLVLSKEQALALYNIANFAGALNSALQIVVDSDKFTGRIEALDAIKQFYPTMLTVHDALERVITQIAEPPFAKIIGE